MKLMAANVLTQALDTGQLWYISTHTLSLPSVSLIPPPPNFRTRTRSLLIEMLSLPSVDLKNQTNLREKPQLQSTHHVSSCVCLKKYSCVCVCVCVCGSWKCKPTGDIYVGGPCLNLKCFHTQSVCSKFSPQIHSCSLTEKRETFKKLLLFPLDKALSSEIFPRRGLCLKSQPQQGLSKPYIWLMLCANLLWLRYINLFSFKFLHFPQYSIKLPKRELKKSGHSCCIKSPMFSWFPDHYVLHSEQNVHRTECTSILKKLRQLSSNVTVAILNKSLIFKHFWTTSKNDVDIIIFQT